MQPAADQNMPAPIAPVLPPSEDKHDGDTLPHNESTAAPRQRPAENPVVPNLVMGGQYFVKGPAVNAAWEIGRVVMGRDPNNVFIEFPDGSQYLPTDPAITIGPAVEQAAPAAVQPAMPQLRQDYATFQQLVVRLNAEAQRLFELPLDMVITMVHRLATQKELPGTGRMRIMGGTVQFVPNDDTLSLWLETYLLEIQQRESKQGDAEL